ncbi:hypothetical protein [uncultured Xanthomonas sp.]|uniref:hypothetical protein n=1 Tax=uncultured Xanthomonas sp. TaxID=152831 RepID=UPI0025D9C84D|nr:hypothetical protein [uncultured Xanthomonas sp.]
MATTTKETMATTDGRTASRQRYEKSRQVKRRDARMIQAARKRARQRGIEFSIPESEVVVPDVCPALGIPLVGTARGGSRDDAPSMDRINPNLGYVSGNVAVISMRANRIKNNATSAELRAIADWMDSL